VGVLLVGKERAIAKGGADGKKGDTRSTSGRIPRVQAGGPLRKENEREGNPGQGN